MKDVSIDIQEFLAQTSLFEDLPASQLAALAKIALKQRYRKGESLFWEGDQEVGFFITITGKIKIFKTSPDGKEQILQIFGPGEHFAEVPAFDGRPFPASGAAIEPSEVLFFPRPAFLKLLEAYPTLAINILATVARHLRRFAQLIEDLSLKEVPGRLAAYLLYLSETTASEDAVELDITKGQLASFLGTIPETLSRVFSKLTGEGILEIKGSTIQLLDRQRLNLLATGQLKMK